jgi:CRISPR/Cas system CMR subunit Cmr4 (Cas7 group RAMP superfamily)
LPLFRRDNIHLIRRKVNFEQKLESEKEEGIESNCDPKEKENYNACMLKSSRRVLCKNSINILVSENTTNFNSLTEESALTELLAELQKCKEDKEELQAKIKHFKTDQRYRKFLIKKGFLTYLYQNLGVEMEKDEDCLSELSI